MPSLPSIPHQCQPSLPHCWYRQPHHHLFQPSLYPFPSVHCSLPDTCCRHYCPLKVSKPMRSLELWLERWSEAVQVHYGLTSWWGSASGDNTAAPDVDLEEKWLRALWTAASLQHQLTLEVWWIAEKPLVLVHHHHPKWENARLVSKRAETQWRDPYTEPRWVIHGRHRQRTRPWRRYTARQ